MTAATAVRGCGTCRWWQGRDAHGQPLPYVASCRVPDPVFPPIPECMPRLSLATWSLPGRTRMAASEGENCGCWTPVASGGAR